MQLLTGLLSKSSSLRHFGPSEPMDKIKQKYKSYRHGEGCTVALFADDVLVYLSRSTIYIPALMSTLTDNGLLSGHYKKKHRLLLLIIGQTKPSEKDMELTGN